MGGQNDENNPENSNCNASVRLFLTYGVLPQVLAAGKDTPMIVVAHRAGAKVAPENTLAALEQAIRDGAPSPRSMYSSYPTGH